jgi:hypothetical protein
MGYKRPTYVLIFDDPQYEGLEIRTRGASIGQVTELMDLMRLADLKDVSKQDLAELEKLWRMFAGCPDVCTWPHEDQGGNHYVSKIKEWNLEDEDDVPVPPTYAGFMDQDLNFQMAVAFAWLDAAIGTPGELGKDSSSGGQSPEVSIPMEVLSLVPAS